MHGRTAFGHQEGDQPRHVQVGYILSDDLYSKRRVLEKQRENGGPFCEDGGF